MRRTGVLVSFVVVLLVIGARAVRCPVTAATAASPAVISARAAAAVGAPPLGNAPSSPETPEAEASSAPATAPSAASSAPAGSPSPTTPAAPSTASPAPPVAPAVSLPPLPPEVRQDPLRRRNVRALMRQACDYQLAMLVGKRKSNGWIRSTFYAGVMAAYQETHDRTYRDKARRWADQFHWSITGKDPYFADNQCCVQTYAELAMGMKDPAKLDPVRSVFDREIDLALSGRKRWWWCDALFMAPAAWTRVSDATGDPKYTDFMKRLWWDTTDFLYDKQENLFYRDKSYFDRRAQNGQKVFWSRGNGWVLAGLVRVLEYLPENDPDRERFVDLYRAMTAKIVTLQGEDGLWRASLLDREQFPEPETSGTGLFVYALAWGINHHLVDRDAYLPAVRKGWTGLVDHLDAGGRLGSVQSPGAAPAHSRPEDTQEYGVGAFLLAGSEVAALPGTKK